MEAAAAVAHTARAERNGAHGHLELVMVQLVDGKHRRHIMCTQIINDPVVALVVLDVILKTEIDIYVSNILLRIFGI